MIKTDARLQKQIDKLAQLYRSKYKEECPVDFIFYFNNFHVDNPNEAEFIYNEAEIYFLYSIGLLNDNIRDSTVNFYCMEPAVKRVYDAIYEDELDEFVSLLEN